VIKLQGSYEPVLWLCLKCGKTYDDVTSAGLCRLKTSHDVKQDGEHDAMEDRDDGDAG
jgi:hypothetical protein